LEQFARLASGIEGLDRILGGGFVRGASYIMQGQPGAGKTILSNQIAFDHVAKGGRVLYVTLLSESHDRLFQALSTLDFFDEDRLGRDIIYVSVFQAIRDEGLDAVVKLLRKETKRHGATLLIFDGLLNARDRAASDFDVKTFVAEVQGQAAFVDCTVLFLTSTSIEDTSPEHTMVDGVLNLSDTLTGVRTVRKIQVRKSRGSAAIGGLHSFEITSAGVSVYPRLEAMLRSDHPADDPLPGKLSSGIVGLDAAMGGGLPAGSLTLLTGASGSGKTSIGLHFLSQASREEPGMHFGFFETPARLRAKAGVFGMTLPAPGDPALRIDWRSPAENLLDKLGHQLLALVAENGIKRLFLDGFGGFETAAAHPGRLIPFFSILAIRLRELGVTTIATWETRDPSGRDTIGPADDVSAILDNLVVLGQQEERGIVQRTMTILKVRDSMFDPAPQPFRIAERGIVVDPRASSTIAPPVAD
jgi:circadian clock protein KaiC